MYKISTNVCIVRPYIYIFACINALYQINLLFSLLLYLNLSVHYVTAY